MSATLFAWGFGELTDFQFFGDSVDHKTDKSGDPLKPLTPCGSRVDVEEVVLLVEHHLENVGVAADKDGGFLGEDEGLDVALVVAGVASDVGHQYLLIFAREKLYLGNLESHVLAVDVAKHSQGGFEVAELAEDART